ncbi:MAG: PilZ domain-containing protein, partial [Terriglobia bacterium]
MPPPTRERRRYVRAALNPRKWVAAQWQGRINTYRCPNMSVGGMFLLCSDPPPRGSVVRFALDIRGQTIRGLGRVASVQSCGMGLQFLSLRTGDRARIRSLVNRFLSPA